MLQHVPGPIRDLMKVLMTEMVRDYAHAHDARVHMEMKDRYVTAMEMIDTEARINTAKNQVEQVQACLQQAKQTWDAIQGTTSCGRIAFAKARDSVITAFHEGIGQLTEIYSTRMVYEKALEQLNDEAHQLLTLAHDDATALSSNRVRDIDERRKFVQDYIRALDNRLVPTQGISGKRAYVPLKMPRDLVDGLRGQELHISMDSHMESNRHKYYVVSHYM